MEAFSASLALWAGSSPVTGEFPTQRPVTRSFDVFFDLCLNKRLSKQLRSWWFETPSRLLWHNCDGIWMESFNDHVYQRKMVLDGMLSLQNCPSSNLFKNSRRTNYNQKSGQNYEHKNKWLKSQTWKNVIMNAWNAKYLEVRTLMTRA